MIERDLSKAWIDDDAYFKEQCQIGRKYERIVAEKLKRHGIEDVQVMDDGFRKSKKDIKKYTESSKDLLIKGWPFEVKSRDIYFNDMDDWPDDKWPIYLETVDSFDKKKEKPVGYIIISQKTKKIMSVSVSTKPTWLIKSYTDKKRMIDETSYSVLSYHLKDEKDTIDALKNMPTRGISERIKNGDN